MQVKRCEKYGPDEKSYLAMHKWNVFNVIGRLPVIFSLRLRESVAINNRFYQCTVPTMIVTKTELLETFLHNDSDFFYFLLIALGLARPKPSAQLKQA